MSEEESPWESEDREIHKAFARQRDVIDCLELDLSNALGDSQDKDAEIERLKAEIKDQMSLIEDNSYQKQLITELCDALEDHVDFEFEDEVTPLITRAREATSMKESL